MTLLGALCAVLLAACGEDASEMPGSSASPEPGTTPPSSADSRAPVLPDLPWFKLPDDWNEQHPILSPNAKIEAHFASLAEREVVANPADGAGRAWLEAVQAIDSEAGTMTGTMAGTMTGAMTGTTNWRRPAGEDGAGALPPTVPASSAQRIEIVFEVGPQGIDEGGLLFVMPEPFWSWSPAQVEDPNALGFTTATSRSPGVDLVALTTGATFRIEGRALAPNEMIDIVVGAGPRGTIVDEFAERGSEILIAVDADGDGIRAWIEDSARIDIAARSGVGIVAFGPAQVAPGDTVEVHVSIYDARGNLARWPRANREDSEAASLSFTLESIGGPSLEVLGLNDSIDEAAVADGPYQFRFDAPTEEGTIRLSLRGRGALEGFDVDVNPIVVRRSAKRLIWADLHGHSQLSDGTGTPRDYFSYARDVARLDAIALTDHDHWGIRPLDESPKRAARILRTALEFHKPGRFVTIPGYEWTSWLHGHRHVLYFDEEAPIHSSIDFATDRPDELWEALRGQRVLTFAHHSAGEPVATNWSFRPDPVLEPLTEISSIHGMSEAADAPLPVYGAIPGNFVRDVLLRGARLGFIGSGDSHDGHPGLAQLAAAGQSGLAGIFTETLDRSGLLEAMRARRTFATNGIRPWLSVSIDETFMGGSLPASTDPEISHRLQIRYEGTAPVERVDLIRGDRIAHLEAATVVRDENDRSIDFEREIPRLVPGEFHYVRIIEQGGGVAWSSPIFAD